MKTNFCIHLNFYSDAANSTFPRETSKSQPAVAHFIYQDKILKFSSLDAKNYFSFAYNFPILLNKMSDSGVHVGETGSGQVEEEFNPDQVLPHLRSEKDVRLQGLRCSKCHDFFRGQVFGCTKNHATCSLCCGVDIKGGVEEDVHGQDEEGGDGASNVEVDNKNENVEENKLDGMICPMEDCNSEANIS